MEGKGRESLPPQNLGARRWIPTTGQPLQVIRQRLSLTTLLPSSPLLLLLLPPCEWGHIQLLHAHGQRCRHLLWLRVLVELDGARLQMVHRWEGG